MAHRKKWAEFEEILKLSNSEQANWILGTKYSVSNLRKFQNKYGKGLLHMSVELNKPLIALFLLGIGCQKDQINRQDGRSPLALALSLPHTSRVMAVILLDTRVDYSWKQIMGPSKTLEFGNEKVAEIFRSHVTSYLSRVLNNGEVYMHVDNDDDRIACRTVKFLYRLGWPLESLSFLRLGDTSTRHAQLYYATDESHAVYVKHLLDNNNYSSLALSYTLNLAVTVANPKSTVIMKLLVDKGALAEENGLIGIDLLCKVLIRNDFDKTLILMNNGISFFPSIDFLINKRACKKSFGTPDLCLNVFVKPTTVFDQILGYGGETITYSLTRYHSRIESFEFSQELKNKFPWFHSLFVKCRLELAKMKDTAAYENLSVLDIIDKPLDTIASYTCNKKFIEKLEAIEFKKSFPYFSDVILKRLEVARRIRDWTDQSKDFLTECLPVIIGSNNLILSMIVKYVGVPNLIVMSLE